MSGAFTPGPWLIAATDDSLVVVGRTKIAATFEVPGDVWGSSNARLIAAAPDLYETLDELVTLMRDVVDGNYTPDSFTTQPAEIALAKARGEA